MRIRKFQDKDAKEVCNLIKRNDLEVASKFYPKEVIDNWLHQGMTPEIILKKSRERICFIAEEDKKVIGYISLLENEIKKCFVLPEFQKKGIGRKLIDEIEKTARLHHLNKLIVQSNFYAESFYNKSGFKRIKDIWEKVGDVKFKLVYMEKELK